MKVKFITSIYSNLYGTEFGGRINRGGHYKWSLLSLLKMTDADFVCYTSKEELNDLEKFFYEDYNIDKSKLHFRTFDLNECYFKEIINKYKNIEETKRSDRCIEIQYMKFIWPLEEDQEYDYYFWIDAGLSHCGLIPSRYLSLTGLHARGYFESSLFNNTFLSNLIEKTGEKFILIGKENQRNYWSRPVNSVHYTNFDTSLHIIGGLFGGKKNVWNEVIKLFEESVYKVLDYDKILYHEENLMTLIYFNNKDLFNVLEFDTWWHEEERLPGIDIVEHTKHNKSFYKILEELNNIKQNDISR